MRRDGSRHACTSFCVRERGHPNAQKRRQSGRMTGRSRADCLGQYELYITKLLARQAATSLSEYPPVAAP